MDHSDTTTTDSPPPATTSLTPDRAGEFDFVILVDRSSSMGKASVKMPGKTRWQEGAELVFGIAQFCEKHDSDGITLVLFGSDVSIEDGVTAARVDEVFGRYSPAGSTPLGSALRTAFSKRKSGKRLMIVVATDGEPDSQSEVRDSLINFSKTLDRDEDATVLFLQIGDDPSCTAFLNSLDDNLVGAGAKFDIVDVVSRADAEKLSPAEILGRAIVG